MSADNNIDAGGGAFRKAMNEIAEPFRGLVTSPRALWGLYISYLLEGLVYFGVLTILGKYLSENVGLSDLHAGWVYSGFTGGITLAMLFLGGLSDKLGIRRALLLSLGIMIFGRALLGISGTFFDHGLGAGSPMFLAVVLGLFIIVIGYGTYQPAAYSAVKRFTDKRTASISYAMIYGLMNLGAFFSGGISPLVRRYLGGIVSVYWVYAVLTLLAFLTVLFVMTKKVVKRDTLTNIDLDAKDENGELSAVDKPKAKLLTPSFLLFTGGSVVAAVLVIYMAVTAPIPAGKQHLRETGVTLRQVATELEESATASAWTAAIDRGIARLQPLSDQLLPPSQLQEGARLDTEVYELTRAQLNSNVAYLSEVRSVTADSLQAGSTEALRVRDEIRYLALVYMAVAYSLVSPVDEAVLLDLQTRYKEIGQDPIPLTADQQRRILALVKLDFPELSGELDAVIGRSAASITATVPVLGNLFTPLLAGDQDFVRQDMLPRVGSVTPKVQEIIKTRLLHQAVFLLREVSTQFAPPEESVGFFKQLWWKITGAPVAETVVHFIQNQHLVGNWLASEAAYTNDLEVLLGGAEDVPWQVRMKAWGQRYGIWILVCLVCLLLLGSILLRKRPEHPFNNNRFVFFIFVLIPVQTLFAHNWLTIPYYIDRAFGGTSVGDNFEFFSNLNPILIFFLAPMVAALTTRAKVYPMMIWGTLVMGAPAFLLALTPSPTFLLTYIVLMSIGEAMWQPRFLQWVAEIAPEGQTGAYMGIGQFPWFLTKVVTGAYSGYFLSQYCPAVGPQNTQFMWLIYAFIAMITPVALWMAKGWMVSDKGKQTI
ncbi:MAG: MFS transporter [bacterium]